MTTAGERDPEEVEGTKMRPEAEDGREAGTGAAGRSQARLRWTEVGEESTEGERGLRRATGAAAERTGEKTETKGRGQGIEETETKGLGEASQVIDYRRFQLKWSHFHFDQL